MDEDVQSILEKTEQLTVEQVFPRNWCDLPVELRFECVKRMGVNTRKSLRCTSHAEKNLVDSQKYDLETVGFNYYISPTTRELRLKLKVVSTCREYDKIWCSEPSSYDGSLFFQVELIRAGSFEDILKTFLSVLKTSHIRNLSIEGKCVNSKTAEILAACREFAPFRFDKFYTDECGALALLFLSNCQKRMDCVEFLDYGVNPISQLVRNRDLLAAVTNTWQFEYECFVEPTSDAVSSVIQTWIDKDQRIESKFIVAGIGENWDDIFEHFIEKFADRIIEKTDDAVRIKMDGDVQKHILVRHCPQEIDVMVCKVIPASQEPWEYEKDSGWITVLI